MSLVSIIIPCYNYGWLLAETLDSILAQTHTNWECIVVDDGSQDNSRTITKSYQALDIRFRYIHQANAGISSARNHGLRLARGEYVQFLDADDLLVPSKLANQVAFLATQPEVDIVYGDVRYFPHGEPEVHSRSLDLLDTPWMTGAQGQGVDVLRFLLKRNIMVTPAPLFRAALLREVGFFDERLRATEDWEYWVRCALAGANFRYYGKPDTWSLVRVHGTSTSQDIAKMYKFEVIARLQIQKSLEDKKYTELIALNKNGVNFLIDAIAEFARKKIGAGNKKGAIEDYLYLARITGKYIYYLKNMLYWLKNAGKMPS